MAKNSLPKEIEIFEVGPRDGLQNQSEYIPVEKKIEYINRLVDAGCRKIEVTSFVHPKWVPQMRDAKDVFKNINKVKDVCFSAFVPNLKGMENAIETGLKEVVTIISASESHNQKNLNKTTEESFRELEHISKLANKNDIQFRAYIGTSFGCPIEGEVLPNKVVAIAKRMEECNVYQVSLGDTTGMADPISVRNLCQKVREGLKKASLATHFHQSGGIEFANVLAALDVGVTVFDGATGGLGGCPYAPGATGNIATELLVEMFDRMGILTRIDLEKIGECGKFAFSLSKYF